MLLTRCCLLKVLLILLTLILIIVTNTTKAHSFNSIRLIHYSATGNATMVRWLLRMGADPNFANRRYDIESIAHLNGRSRSNRKNKYITALVAAIKNDHLHIADILLEAGADPSIQNLSKETALAVAAAHSDNKEFMQKLLNKLDELGKKKELDTPDSFGTTPLMKAIANKHADVSQLLIDEGADINAEDRIGNTPLLLAVKQSHPRIVRILLDRKVNITCRKNAPECPIIQASRSGNKEIIRMLLDAGADINAQNEFQNTALTVAVQNGDVSIAEMLLEEGADPNIGKPKPIIQAVKRRDTAIIDLLLKRRVELDVVDEEGHTALIIALQNEYADVAHRLLRAGANPNVRNTSNEPAIIIALKKGYRRVFNELLANENINVNAQNADGDTALIVAAKEGYLDAVYRLLENNANPNIPNLAGETLLKMIVGSDNHFHNIPSSLVQLADDLINKYGADPDIEGDFGGITGEVTVSIGELSLEEACTTPLLPVLPKAERPTTALARRKPPP